MENTEPTPAAGTPVPRFSIFPFYSVRQAGFLIAILAVVFYSPSFNNEYALDDGIIIHQNNYVIEGARGIGGILTKDAYHAFYRRMNATDQLQGGRYRPLTTISYAIEQEIIGPYRSGYYMRTEDLNRNGVLDSGRVSYKGYSGKEESGYEYNAFIDRNNDGKAQPEECHTCWDLNRNFSNDPAEDLNADGVFNEVDCQTYGSKLRHFNNIVLYALCCLLLYHLFSRHFFRERQDLAFLAALIFTIHPVHSEAVANVKGRDEIFSMIFIALTFIFSFRFTDTRRYRHLFLAALSLFGALMSKEYAAGMFLLVPLALYVFGGATASSYKGILPALITFVLTALALVLCDIRGLYIGTDWQFFLGVALIYIVANALMFREVIRERNMAALLLGMFSAGIAYLCLRLNAVNMAPGAPDTEILNNPFLLASESQAFATKIYNLVLYLRLFLFPHPLVSDYSYATIAYRDLSSWDFILSALVNGALLVTGIVLAVKRHPLGFALLTWYVFLLFVSNLPYLTGTMINENLMFHPSMGMSIVAAWLLLKLVSLMPANRPAAMRATLLLFLGGVLVAAGSKAWERSRDWKNDVTLFLKDVKNAPHSVLVLGNAGARWIDLADTREITGFAIPGSDTTRFNDYNGQLVITEEEMEKGGYEDKREAALNKGIIYLLHAVSLHPRYVNGFLNLGLAYYKLGKEREAIFHWKYAESLYPNNPYLANYYHVFSSQLRHRGAQAMEAEDYSTAEDSYRKLITLDPNNSRDWRSLGEVYGKLGRKNIERKYLDKAERLDSLKKAGDKKSDPPGYGITAGNPC